MNGIDKMTALILSEAEADRTARLDKAEEEAKRVLENYCHQAAALKAAEADKTDRETAAVLERAQASAHQAERNILLKNKSDLLDRVYEGALERLCQSEGEKAPAYIAMLDAIFDAVLAEQLAVEKSEIENDLYEEYFAPSEYVLLLNRRDQETIGKVFLSNCGKKLKKAGKTVSIGQKAPSIKGGFILVCGDVELNCSLELYMNRIRGITEGEVCQILFA